MNIFGRRFWWGLSLFLTLSLALSQWQGYSSPVQEGDNPSEPVAGDARVLESTAGGSLTISGRRGAAATVQWDTTTHTAAFIPTSGVFPWDWISFVGPAGAITLNGYPNVIDTLAQSDPASLIGAMPGDILKIKGSGVLSMAHLTKIGLVIGSGANAQRAWLSSGVIQQYILAPEYAGYQVSVLGRNVTVRLSSLNPADYQSVGVIEVSIDNPSGARLVLASDLEPALDYATAIEWKNRTDTRLSFDSANQAVVGKQGKAGNAPVYLYSSLPLQSWSANNLSYDQYLSADSLDGLIRSSGVDGRVALSVNAQPVQVFYIGTQVLANAARSNPNAELDALRLSRLAILNELPQISSASLPQFGLVNFLSNLTLSYLVNSNGSLFYSDKALVYTPDALMPLVVTSHVLGGSLLNNYKTGLEALAQQLVSSPVSGNYSYKYDSGVWATLPSWYAGNLPDLIHYQPNRSLDFRESYSDAYATALFINSILHAYQASGDLGFAQSLQGAVQSAVGGLQSFDSAYDAQRGQDGNLFPNLLVPMGDLGLIAGEYPGETAQTIYAYEDAASLFDVYGLADQAGDLRNNYVTPMKVAFDAYFWDGGASFYLPKADANTASRPAGTFYNDRWAHTVFVPLRGSLGQDRLAALLAILTSSDFSEPGNDIHWLAKGSENFVTPGRWGFSPNYTNGWGMEGGYLVLPNAIPALGYYHLGQAGSAESYANAYFAKWLQYGPYETMMEWNGETPGKFGESSLYIEAAAATTWLLQEALGLAVDGSNVLIQPKLSGTFTLTNLQITSGGLTAVVDYGRDAQGAEWVSVLRNDGLNILTPNVIGGLTATPTATSNPTTPPPTATSTPTTPPSTATSTPTTPPPSATGTPLPPTPAPTSTATFPSPSATQANLGAGDVVYLSPDDFGVVGTVSYSDEDILQYDVSAAAWSLVFDGSDVGLGGSLLDLDAFDRQDDGSWLMSFSSPVSLPGAGSVGGEDIVRFTPTSLGETTTGTWSLYFDGSDVGLAANSENIDAMAFAPDGRLLVSAIGAVSVPGVSANDEDLLAFSATSLGANTAGTWSLYFDGSDVGLDSTAEEDLDAAWIDPAGSGLYLSTLGAFDVQGAAGGGADIFWCVPSSLGDVTACIFSLFWSAADAGLTVGVDGLDLQPGSGGSSPTPTPTNTPVSTPTSTPTPTNTPTGTSTYTPTPTNTPASTSTYAPTPTNTPVSTSTYAPTPTNTPASTSTYTPTPTNTPASTSTYAPTPTNTPASTPTYTPTPTATSTPPPGGGSPKLYLSAMTSGIAGGVAFEDEDILIYDLGSSSWSMYFDGSDVGLSGIDVSGFDRQPDGTLLMSIAPAANVPGLGWVDDSDIIRFIPIHLGDATDGTFELYFDGSDVGLDANSEALDAIAFAPDGRLLISVIGSVSAPSLAGADEDLFAFDPVSLGASTAGTWSLYFDGSDVGLNTTADEDIIAAWVDPSGGNIYLSTLGVFSVNGAGGDGADIFICNPASVGENTSCTFSLYWDGSAHGFAGIVVDGMDIDLNPGSGLPSPTPCPVGPVRIMPLGASFTQGYGSTDTNGYRRRLYLSLLRDGYSVDFVGSQQDGLADFDYQHEGHPGWMAEGGTGGGVAANVYNWLNANPADVVLLHVGTNDISTGEQSPLEIAHILDEIDRYDPNVTVVLALIINRKTYSPETAQFNLDVQAMAEGRIAQGDKIVIVDQEHALNYVDDMYDNLHPNDAGYTKVAAVWLAGLETFLPGCR